ncbi:MAG: TetR/AcrR family transcriptional regulator [Bacteroidota bacterium]
MEEKLSTIIEQSSQLFMKFGIRSLTMDDVAKNLRISKKTLYQFVTDKDDLVNKCIDAACDRDMDHISCIAGKYYNAIDELLAISTFVSGQLNNIHPSIFFDLEKYHPQALAKFEKHRHHSIFGSIKKNIEDGMAQDFYRKDLNAAFTAWIYMSAVDNVLHGDLSYMPNSSMGEVYQEMVRYHLHAMASKKGLEYLKNLNNNQESTTK